MSFPSQMAPDSRKHCQLKELILLMICNNLYLAGRCGGILAFVHLCKMAKVAKVARRRCCRGKSSSRQQLFELVSSQ